MKFLKSILVLFMSFIVMSASSQTVSANAYLGTNSTHLLGGDLFVTLKNGMVFGVGGIVTGKRIRESITVTDKVCKRVIHDLVREVVGVTDEVRKRGAVKVREVLVLGDIVGKRCGKVLRDSVGIVDYVRRRYEEIIMLVDRC